MALFDLRIAAVSITVLLAAACKPPAQPAPSEPPVAAQAAAAQAPAEPAQPAQAPEPTAAPTPSAPALKPAAQPLAVCDSLCAHTLTLKCGALDECLKGCQEMAGYAQCSAETATVLDCMAAQPAANFECDSETKAPAMREGHCDAEQAAVAKCLEPKAPAH